MRIAFVTDIHMDTDDREMVSERLESLSNQFASADLDVIVALGDQIANGTPDQDRRHLRAVVDVLEVAGPPVTFLRGNHDPKKLQPDELDSILGEPWGRVEGTDGQAVYLDSSAPWIDGPAGTISDEQLKFLDRALDGVTDAVVCVHHPVGDYDVGDSVWFGDRPDAAICRIDGAVREVLARHDVAAVVNGHLHEQYRLPDRDPGHVTVPAFNHRTPDSGVTGAHAILTAEETVRVRIDDGYGNTDSLDLSTEESA